MNRWLIYVLSILALGSLAAILWQMYLDTEGYHLGLFAILFGLLATIVFICLCVFLSLQLRAPTARRRVRSRARNRSYFFLLLVLALGSLSFILGQLYLETEGNHFGLFAHFFGLLAILLLIWSCIRLSLRYRMRSSQDDAVPSGAAFSAYTHADGWDENRNLPSHPLD